MEKETLLKFSHRILQFNLQINPNYIDENKKDSTILELLSYFPSLEELNLNNQNFGDYFLKKLSHKLDFEPKSFLTGVKIFRLRDNARITSVGLKYLYCTSVERKDIELIDVTQKTSIVSGATYFVNNGLFGLIEWTITDKFQKFLNVSKKKRTILIICDWEFFKFSFFILIFSPIIIFHFLEKFLHFVPIFFDYLFSKNIRIKNFLNGLWGLFMEPDEELQKLDDNQIRYKCRLWSCLRKNKKLALKHFKVFF